MKTRNNYFQSKSILKVIVLLSIPILISNILKSVNNAVDMMFFSQMTGVNTEVIQDQIVATTLHFPVYNTFIAIGQAIGIAAMAFISQYLGMKAKKHAQVYASKFFFLIFLGGLFTTGLSLLLSQNIVSFLGTRGSGTKIANDYFQIRAFEYIPLFIFILYQFIRQSEGKTIEPVIVNCVGILINILFTYVFVVKLNMGAFGAGLGTLIGEIFICIIVLFLIFIPQKNKLTITFKHMFAFKINDIKNIVKVALPAFISYVSTSICFVLIQKVTLSFGKDVSSGFGGANRISGFISNAVSSFATVLGPFVGSNIGAKKPKRAKSAYYKIILFSIVISSLLGLMFLLLGSWLARLFLGKVYSGSVTPILNEFLIWFILSQIQMSFIWASQGIYNGSGNSKYSFLQSLIRLWVIRIPLIYIGKYVFNLGWNAVWFAMIISNSVVIITDSFIIHKLPLTPKVKT